jgi:hypothetical protein
MAGEDCRNMIYHRGPVAKTSLPRRYDWVRQRYCNWQLGSGMPTFLIMQVGHEAR